MYAAIRIRGSIGVNKEVKETLALLRLNRANHMVLLPEERQVKGMLKKTEAYLTYGEINKKILAKVLEKKGEISEKKMKELKAKGFEELAEAILEGKKTETVKGKVFRLHPPKKGFERGGIKKPYSVGGALGYRAGDINGLIEKMV